MHIILFDDETRDHLLPFTFTRPVADLRLGILTIKEKWEFIYPQATFAYITQNYLAEKYPIDFGDDNLVINGSALPSPQLCALLNQMDLNEAFLLNEELIAAKLDGRQFERLVNDQDIGELKGYDLEDTDFIKIDRLWDLYLHNHRAIKEDVERLTKQKSFAAPSSTNRVLGASQVFIEEGASVECATLNAETGPIFIAAQARVMEGSLLRGPIAIGPKAVVKMGARIYGGTTIGPGCKVGGEINNSILLANSNKGHDGYLGNAVLGEWCNIGADSNNSNLKNNYDQVKLWSYPESGFRSSGQQFCGLFMGDHSKCGINTMFNTGTVVGVSANIFGAGFPRNFLPSFCWGGAHGLSTYKAEKAFETIERVMKRRDKEFTIQDRLIMLRIFEETSKYRPWEKK